MDRHLSSEVAKYKKLREVWAPPQSRAHTVSAEVAFKALNMCPGDTVLDAGAGMGYQTQWFQNNGLTVYSTDIVPMFEQCIAAPLWDMSEISKTDWVFCADVLEHIPPDLVDKSLSELKRIATKGIYLDICCREDNKGSLIGEKLHLTVQPPEWWLRKINLPTAKTVFKDDQLIVCSTFSS